MLTAEQKSHVRKTQPAWCRMLQAPRQGLKVGNHLATKIEARGDSTRLEGVLQPMLLLATTFPQHV